MTADQEQPVGAATASRWTRRRIPLAVTGLLALALAAGALVGWSALPEQFPEPGDAIAHRNEPGDLTPFHATVAAPDPRHGHLVVALTGVTADVRANSAESGFTYSLCSTTPAKTFIGGSSDPLTRTCTDLQPVTGDTLFRPSAQMLVATVTPTRPGVTRIDHFTLTYRYEFRWYRFLSQTEDTGTRTRLTVPGAATAS